MRSRSRPGLRRSRAIWECPDRRPSGPVSLGKSGTWTGTAGFGLVQTGSQSVRDRTSPTLEDRACMPDSEGNKVIGCFGPCIKAVGRHHIGDIWVTSDTEAGCNVLISTVSEWLPRLSDQLSYVCKIYPILIHGIPISFDTLRTSRDIADLIDSNTDTITRPLALQRMQMLAPKCCGASQSTHGSLIIHFTDLELPLIISDSL